MTRGAIRPGVRRARATEMAWTTFARSELRICPAGQKDGLDLCRPGRPPHLPRGGSLQRHRWKTSAATGDAAPGDQLICSMTPSSLAEADRRAPGRATIDRSASPAYPSVHSVHGTDPAPRTAEREKPIETIPAVASACGDPFRARRRLHHKAAKAHRSQRRTRRCRGTASP